MILNVCSRNSRNLIEENPGLRNPLMLVLQSPRKCHLPSSCGLWIKNALFALQSPNLRQAFSQLTTSPNIPHKLFPAASHIFFFLFLMQTFFFYLIKSATTLLLLYTFCFFRPWGMWELSSPTRDRTPTSCTGRQSLNHWTTREVPHTLILLAWPLMAFQFAIFVLKACFRFGYPWPAWAGPQRRKVPFHKPAPDSFSTEDKNK